MKRIAPVRQLRFALAQQRADQALKGLRQGGIRDVALVLVELARCKEPRGGTSTLCSSLTTEDLPIPEYPETSTSSGVPLCDDAIERGE